MKFMTKNLEGFDFILTKNFKLFTDCGDWFCYILFPQYTVRFSSTGLYIYNREKDKFIW